MTVSGGCYKGARNTISFTRIPKAFFPFLRRRRKQQQQQKPVPVDFENYEMQLGLEFPDFL